MKNFKLILLTFGVALIFGACSNKDNYGVTFSQMGLYFQWGGESQTISYTPTNIASIELKSATSGWTCKLNQQARTITITPPADPDTDSVRDEQREGDIVFTVTSKKGKTSQYTIDCYIIGDSMVFLNAGGQYANSYVLTTPKAAYSLDVTHNGAGQSLSGAVDVIVVWQSYAAMIEHLVYDDSKGIATFYIDAMMDEDAEEDTYIKEDGKFILRDGNAVIAAVDSNNNILWSWHLWFSKASANPLEDYSTYANGVTFMNRNLGAYANSNGATDDTSLILGSYGLYYQWGRKDPFLRPYYHDCSGAVDEYVYGNSGSVVYLETAQTSAEVGTVEYSIAHPTTFITNSAAVEENGDGVGDWLHTPNNTLWSGTTKSAYDPCPYGWRVPAGSDFDVLSLPAAEDEMPLEQARKRFGWKLSDGVNSYFYLAAGLRTYYNGTIHNMNYKDDVYPSQPSPWEGYYWTAGTTADGKQSTCMYFDLTTTRTINKFNINYPSKRANGMQIRCVKVK